MITRLAHVCFFTDQPEPLKAFYRDLLGFPFVFDMKHDDGTPFGWYFDCGNRTFIEIFDQKGAVKQWGGDVIALKQNSRTPYRHLCFEVEGLKEERQRLLDKGVEVTEIIQGMDHSYQCWIKDPDSNPVELMEYTEDSMQFSR
ncbi:VOC family protein [Pelagicoccus sp. SDUM812003]|uniref:VOC family protein n=1 Tax=Pelagicoccus sp. SDUM812003 TaxID=3041267 RepID=UPI00280D831C|nr:VOC family protein [Pelagicoccus sp. SDUM812003]MDQ8203102.1 VOC family protein [Pelagicoccus sp. SDUM812003]